MKKSVLIVSLLFFSLSHSQEKIKSVHALRISNSPSIDGVLDEDFWKDAEPAQNFQMFKPGDGGAERENMKTVVKIAYDDEAIYFGATMYDDNTKAIPLQFGGRDEFGQVDFFLISINPNNDGQNDTEFVVMSTGAQGDAKISSMGEDFSWDAVWESDVKINGDSWVAEIKIPYAALRFSNSNEQTWGVNFHRKINRLNEQYSWNYIDKKTGLITQYSGIITGIKNIKPPTRLSFSPYAFAAVNSYNGNSETDYAVGMDLKYGINESFTLDATLIPDFGQTAFDDQVLNLGPFEQQYSEKRPFFTEGTELFNKGRLFYSRRIGNTPVGYGLANTYLNENEEIINNPTKVNMINALKISGRTKKGLGIGFFNAITEKTSAEIKNTVTQETREIVTEPLANYNVMVLDQQFNKNSSVTFVNTNVTRNGSFRDANVSAFLFSVADKNNSFKTSGDFKISNILENGENKSGFSGFMEVGKVSGNYQYEIGHKRSDKKYDIKDLGFQSKNNYADYWTQLSYRIFEPTKTFDEYRLRFTSVLNYQNNSNDYAGNYFELDFFFFTVKRIAFGGELSTNIGDQYDFYAPRVDGRFLKQKSVYALNGWISSDYRKKFAIDVRGTFAKRYTLDNKFAELSFSPRYRFSNKFSTVYKLKFSKLTNEEGWVTNLDNGSIIFGNRDVKTVTNTLTGNLSFNTKSTLALSFRHYWSPVQYDADFFELNNEGTLNASSYQGNHNINYNIWNLDLSYSWEFAPGSQLLLLYRNAVFNEDKLAHLDFKKNLDNLFAEPFNNNISVKFIYYLDYNNVKSWL
ncbi:MAG: carbohydrate binding family 9 domain-containing protein [Gelidibacter sp.]|nr:carbohydrate binding family 9 domain-containing protein [Gelidibacter sp.]